MIDWIGLLIYGYVFCIAALGILVVGIALLDLWDEWRRK